ncbi:uncharacterized protein LOC131953467 [Physella acuta]|uniref:uncharacterized protein LOC131953467 n=1 Tax=Physella acuta TaxID=109671 RepID=UPI0027DDB138|nr:uncharacterized protein LOC131953467 [Physella acuta]
MASKDITQYFEGHHEVEECEPDDTGERENNTNTRWTRCAKNPGHVDFIPIKDFSLSHLPAAFQDDDLYRLIKGIADLTVRISVKFTSLRRPQFLNETSTPYPCYNLRGSNLLRNGTGKIWRIDIETTDGDKTCPCPVCVKSSEPSRTWARVYVATATHVLYDETEVEKCECAVGYDDVTGPKESLRGWCMDGPNAEIDLAYFSCVTHDLDLAQNL